MLNSDLPHHFSDVCRSPLGPCAIAAQKCWGANGSFTQCALGASGYMLQHFLTSVRKHCRHPLCSLVALFEPGPVSYDGDLDNISLNFLFFLPCFTLSFSHSRFLEHFPSKSSAPKSLPQALLLGESILRQPTLPTLQQNTFSLAASHPP